MGGFSRLGSRLAVLYRGGVGLLQLLDGLCGTPKQTNEGGAGGDHKEHKEQEDIHDEGPGAAQPAQRVHTKQNGACAAPGKGGAAAVQSLDALGKGALRGAAADDMGDAAQQQDHQHHAGAFEPRRDGGTVHGQQHGHDHHKRAHKIAAPAHQAAQHIMYGIPGVIAGDGRQQKQQHPQRKEDDRIELPLGLQLRLGGLFGCRFAFFCR